jgi:hypothetical protein
MSYFTYSWGCIVRGGFLWLKNITQSNQKQWSEKRQMVLQVNHWHDIFHIGLGISPRLPYQAGERSWRADMDRGLIPRTIWKMFDYCASERYNMKVIIKYMYNCIVYNTFLLDNKNVIFIGFLDQHRAQIYIPCHLKIVIY